MARAGLTAERLARAGAELADEVGFDQVTVSALARRFDVKVASLYSHVKNSHDLRTRIALLALEELADRGAAALAHALVRREHRRGQVAALVRGEVEVRGVHSRGGRREERDV